MRSKWSPQEVKGNEALFNQVESWGCEAANARDWSYLRNKRSILDLILVKLWRPPYFKCNSSITKNDSWVLENYETKRVRTGAWIAN